MSKFTPGPWWLHVEHSTIYVEGKARDPRVTQEVAAVGPKEGGREQQEADARLIAAAPDLLEACQTFAEWLRRESAGSTNEPWAGKRDTPEGEAAWREWYDENLRICDLAQEQVRAAIAKATGETP